MRKKMMKITYRMLDDGIVGENATHRFTVFASDLALKPGVWPAMIETDLGNGMPFLKVNPVHDDFSRFVAYRYLQSNGCISLEIINS